MVEYWNFGLGQCLKRMIWALCPIIMFEGGIRVETQWNVPAGTGNHFCRATGKHKTFFECDGIEEVFMYRSREGQCLQAS